jgi:4-aminobutyrate aminotransferase-like enzyme
LCGHNLGAWHGVNGGHWSLHTTLNSCSKPAWKNGFLFNISGGGKVLRFLPPLIISDEEIMSAFGFLKRFLNI